MASKTEYDLVVIGSGPGGQKAAVAAAKLGKSVAVIERGWMLGGVCVNTGTIPSKTLREAVIYLTGMNQRELYGTSYRVKEHITTDDLHQRTQHVITREIDVVRSQLIRNRIDLFTGHGRFVDPHTVVVENDNDSEHVTVSAENIVIATGTKPARPDDIEFDAGRFQVKGTDKGISIQEIALAEFAGHNYPEGMELGLDSDATYDPENFSFPHGTHLAAVEVDTDTGDARLVKYACVDDIGNVINPLIVDGQIHGGLAQGIAQALYEEVIFDDDGNLTTGTFVDYTLPSAADLPSFLTGQNQTAATSNPLGVKGVGEAGCIASTPAVMNAVVDAVRQYGVNDIRMPASPERVWRAIHQKDGKTETAAEETTAHTDGTSGN